MFRKRTGWKNPKRPHLYFCNGWIVFGSAQDSTRMHLSSMRIISSSLLSRFIPDGLVIFVGTQNANTVPTTQLRGRSVSLRTWHKTVYVTFLKIRFTMHLSRASISHY